MIEKAKKYINEADAILITASNGLSITEGINLFMRGGSFLDDFRFLYEKYNITSLLEAFFSDISDEDRFLFLNKVYEKHVLNYKKTKVMDDLYQIVSKKDYFILTSNGECHFERSGFDLDKIYEVEGTWDKMQCENWCGLYNTSDVLKKYNETHEVRCEKCGGKIILNMVNPNFIENKTQINNFNNFLRKYHNKNLLVIELGMGKNNRLIKAPIMNLISHEKSYKYIVINKFEPYCYDVIKDRTILFEDDIDNVLESIK